MSKILKSVTLGDVKIGGIFRALGKEFVKLDADEHGCLVLAKDIWTRMPFRDGDEPELSLIHISEPTRQLRI